MTGQFWKKKTLQKTIFTSALTIAGVKDMAKTKGKNTNKMCQLIFTYSSGNRNNDAKILWLFTASVKPYTHLYV